MYDDLVAKKQQMEKEVTELEKTIARKRGELASLANKGVAGSTDSSEHSEIQSKEIIIHTINGVNFRGKINIGWEERLSDMFTKVDTPFIILYEASHKGDKNKTYIINKQHIIYIEPVDV